MTSKLWIASKPAQPEIAGYDHLYLVYDPDGNPNSGDEQIFRGGSVLVDGKAKIEIEDWKPIEDSYDKLDGKDPYLDRNYTELAAGQSAEDIKNNISNWVNDVKVFINPDTGNIVTDVPYTLLLTIGDGQPTPATNSNTTIKSALGFVGVDVNGNMPYQGGDYNNGRLSSSAHPGTENYYGGSDQVVVADNAQDRIFYNTDGDNSYVIDVNSFGNGKIYIIEDDNTGTLDKIVLQNIDPSDVRFERDLNGHLKIFFPWDAPDDPSIVVVGQFKDGLPKMNTVWVEPPGGGAPFVLPLNDPDDFPVLKPAPVGGWIPGVRDPFGDGEITFSPLVLDLDGTGINLAALGGEGAVYWNASLGDFANESGWIAEGTGLLAIDLNADGVINDHSELFGTGTIDGFTILSAYDSNSDNNITASDTVWSELLVWPSREARSACGDIKRAANDNVSKTREPSPVRRAA